MQLEIGKTALITTDNWFIAPDGKQYRAVFGVVKAVLSSEATLGVRTNAKSTNWYVVIGNLTIAGCQIHYAIRADKAHFDEAEHWEHSPTGLLKYDTPSRIYNADSGALP